jgi:hypothetical protein
MLVPEATLPPPPPPLMLPLLPTGLAESIGEMPVLLSYFHVSEEKGSATPAVGELRLSWLSEVELWLRWMGERSLPPDTPASRSMPSGSTMATGKEEPAAPPPLLVPPFTAAAAPHRRMDSGAEAIRVTF